jgi:creatinine amidohydrolase
MPGSDHRPRRSRHDQRRARHAGSDKQSELGELFRWEELSAPQIGGLDREAIIVLPVGSVEQHGHHMPAGTDTMLASAVATAAAQSAAVRTVVLPPLWFGFSAHHTRFPGTVTVRPETLIAMIEDVVASVLAHGFRRVVVVNGHGGNAGVMDVLAAKLGSRFYGQGRIACLTYFHLARAEIAALRESPPGGMGHACEFETSMMMHHRPELVDLTRASVCYPDTGSEYLTTDLLGTSSVRTYHDFADLSESGTLGDPTLASAEKGARFMTAVSEALARFLADFSRWPVPGARR